MDQVTPVRHLQVVYFPFIRGRYIYTLQDLSRNRSSSEVTSRKGDPVGILGIRLPDGDMNF